MLRHFLRRHSKNSDTGRGLALNKDLAVSFPLFCPYRGTGPPSSGLGPPSAFASGRFCSHLSPYGGGLLARIILSNTTFADQVFRNTDASAKVVLESVRTFLSFGTVYTAPKSDRLDDQPEHHSTEKTY
jgi:hypothetical protein